MKDFREDISIYLTTPLQTMLANLPKETLQNMTELRIRANQRAVIHAGECIRSEEAVPAKDVERMVSAMLGHAIHAKQEELCQGYVTLLGGYRVGLCGRAVVKEGKIAGMQEISCVSIRIAREMIGVAQRLLPYLWENERAKSLLLVSPPGYGKTTMLRDAARLLSQRGLTVTIVDERSEIAACRQGVPSLDVGENTDVLDGCPKGKGIPLALRAMSPQVMITDEIGGAEDADAIAEAARCGVAIVASAHGASYDDVQKRNILGAILKTQVFDYIAVLSGRGCIGGVYTGAGERIA